MKKIYTSDLKSNQSGFAALVIGLVLVLVLALMTVGFAQLARHEQQQALAHQLADQAYYAAETGVNDVVQAIKNKTAISNVDTGQCATISGVNNVISSTNGSSYSCVIVGLNNPQIVYKNVAPDGSKAFITTTSAPLTSLTINWSSADSVKHTNAVPAANFGQFYTLNQWNSVYKYPAVIEFTITPLGGGVSRDVIINNTYTGYLYPSSNGPNITYAAQPHPADIAGGACVSGDCTATINLSSATPSTQYLVHFVNLYDASDVTITGKVSGGGAALFSGSQASVDATGKARNVLKRIKVTVPLDEPNLFNYALEAQSICKRMVSKDTATAFVNANGSVGTGACLMQ